MKRPLLAFSVILVLSTTTADTILGNIFNTIKKIEKVSSNVVHLIDDKFNPNESWFENTTDRGWVLNNEGKKALENLLLTLPCGWPEYGIPPLAPYTKEDLVIEFKKKLFETLTKLERFRIDGLDILLVNSLKISYTFVKKVKYSITFPKLILTGKVDTDTLIDLMAEYGIKIRFDDKGEFDMMLNDIEIKGSFKYKMPFIFGSVKIYDFNSVISLGSVVSDIKFSGTISKLNDLLNAKLQEYVWKAVNYNKNFISDTIEKTVVPFVNEKMKGHKIWFLIKILASSNKACYPPPMPWDTDEDADEEVPA